MNLDNDTYQQHTQPMLSHIIGPEFETRVQSVQLNLRQEEVVNY